MKLLFSSLLPVGKVSLSRPHNDNFTFKGLPGQFDENGNMINCNLGLKVSNKTFKKKINDGDTLQIGYSLIHSMISDPYLAMDIVKITNGKRDTINSVSNNSASINYSLTDYDFGLNTFEITIFEIQKSSNSIICSLVDTLNFEVVHQHPPL